MEELIHLNEFLEKIREDSQGKAYYTVLDKYLAQGVSGEPLEIFLDWTLRLNEKIKRS